MLCLFYSSGILLLRKFPRNPPMPFAVFNMSFHCQTQHRRSLGKRTGKSGDRETSRYSRVGRGGAPAVCLSLPSREQLGLDASCVQLWELVASVYTVLEPSVRSSWVSSLFVCAFWGSDPGPWACKAVLYPTTLALFFVCVLFCFFNSSTVYIWEEC